jgi:hypothetical protein
MVDGYQILIYGEDGVYATEVDSPNYPISDWGWPYLGQGRTWEWKVRAYRDFDSEDVEYDPEAGTGIWRPSNPGPWSEPGTFTTSS